jgi:hypothetical protein
LGAAIVSIPPTANAAAAIPRTLKFIAVSVGEADLSVGEADLMDSGIDRCDRIDGSYANARKKELILINIPA